MEETSKINKHPYQANEEEQDGSGMSMHDLWNFLCSQWKWFLLSAIICMGLAKLYLATKNNTYKRQAVMLVKEEQPSPYSRRMDALSQINGMMGASSVANECYILSSRQLAREVARKLELDVVYNQKKTLKTTSLYKERPFTVRFADENTIPAIFDMKVVDNESVEISKIQYAQANQATITEEKKQTVRFNDTITTPAGRLVITPEPDYLELFKGANIQVTHLTEESATNSVVGRISASEVDKNSTLIAISCVDTDIKRADDILNTLMETYKQSLVEDKNEVTKNTLEFVEERMKLVYNELDEVEKNLADFKEANKWADASLNAQNTLAQNNAAHARTIELQKQQATAKYLLDYLKKKSQGKELIPTLGGLADVAIQTQISKYNEMRLQRNRLADDSGEENTGVVEMDANLKEMHRTLIASMEGYVNTIDLQVKQALEEEQKLMGNLQSIPQQEKEVMDIARQQEIKHELYKYLLTKREETEMQLAASNPNVRIVEQPFGSNRPIAPRRSVIMLAGLLIGLIIPFAVYYIFSMFNMSVRGRKDIETYTTLSILGEIPRKKGKRGDSGIEVDETSNDQLSEAFLLMRYNLTFMNKDAKVIMFTSTTPGEGKSFVSRNFAKTLTIGNHKVVLVDCDIRRHTQSKVFNSNRVGGLTNYLAGAIDDVDSLITNVQDNENVHLLPAGPVPPNPTELLMNERMKQLIERLKNEYDYVILDCVPAHMMADAAVVSHMSDLTVYVIRDGGIDRRFLPELERIHQEGRFSNLCVVINDIRKKNSIGNYNYDYKYHSRNNYNNSEKKGLLSFLRR